MLWMRKLGRMLCSKPQWLQLQEQSRKQPQCVLQLPVVEEEDPQEAQGEQEDLGVEEGEDLQREIGVEMMMKEILRKLQRK